MSFFEQLKKFWSGNFNTSVYTDKGQRQENQDNYLVIQTEAGQAVAHYQYEQKPQRVKLDNWPPQMMRLAVLDGLGGHPLARQITEITCQELLDIRLSKEPYYFGRIQQQERQQLFDDQAVGSVVLIKLTYNQSDFGFLAINSADAEHFDPRMDTLLLSQFSQLVAKLLAKELGL